jgi:hypothetical protein
MTSEVLRKLLVAGAAVAALSVAACQKPANTAAADASNAAADASAAATDATNAANSATTAANTATNAAADASATNAMSAPAS